MMTWLVGAAAVVMGVAVVAQGAEPSNKAGKVEWVAHRGASYDYPENTMAAFDGAWAWDVDGCENDIQLTKDGKVIVLHDGDSLRTSGGKDGGGVKLVVKEATAEELRKLDVGKWKGAKFAGERMPTLEECLASMPKGKGKRFFIEIKSGSDVVPAAAEVIKKSGRKPEELPLISFHQDAIALSKKLMPEHKAFLLAGAQRERGTRKVIGWSWKNEGQNVTGTLDDVIKAAKEAGADGLDLSWEGPYGEDGVEKIKAAGLEFYVWTVDDPEVAKKFIAQGVKGVTTNRPKWIKEQVEGKE